MMALRAIVLAVTAAVVAGTLGAAEMRLQPSALRLVITAIVALLAPLFWPGLGANPGRTALRVAIWSCAGTLVAALLLLLAGGGRQSLAAVVAACAMLLLILLTAHSLAAAIERRMLEQGHDSGSAAEIAGRAVAFGVAVTGSLPLWLGPGAELSIRAWPGAADAIVGLSPLTHLAVASGNDLLRNEWLYDHSNLAKLAVAYPGPRAMLLAYVSLLSALALASMARRSFRRRAPIAGISRPITEDVP